MSSNVMSLENAVAEALEGSAESRIKTVVRILEKGGATSADDLKYFSWNSLKELGGLSDMETNKIMRFLSKYYPQEYEEHKKLKNLEDEMLRKKELIEYSNKLQIQIYQDRVSYHKQLRCKENLDGQTHSPQAVVVQEPRPRGHNLPLSTNVNSDQHPWVFILV